MEDWLKRGSFTVEAACIMPIVLMVLMGILHLNMYVHNQVWLTAAAYETALDGSIEGNFNSENIYKKAREKGMILANMGFFGGDQISMQIHTGTSVTVTYNLDTIFKNAKIDWSLQARGSSKILDPASWVRKRKAIGDVFGDSK